MQREDFLGREFDWLACDREGRVAIFLTAGYGEVPEAVLDAISDEDAFLAKVTEAIVEHLPQTTKGEQVGRGLRSDPFTPFVGDRGFYVFDWKHWQGPYDLVLAPLAPAYLDDLPPHFRDGAALARFTRLSFCAVTSIRPELEMPCVGRSA